ncbi:YdgA family protein [Cardiobacterium valvarum]|uniref:Uncharacterized protein n=1 Tax=Cardiobacterium valvarum F0432 TaxID=797473 RepID=G9ZCH1_9GAMM|nr:DUF945 family protein [Cardiobacterium valvarum]EHM55786.1 hypothetical protein HMPREF9080_00448 [Cardiobacterium valvarum F0432]
MPNITQNRLTKILAFVAIVWLLIALAAPSFLAPALEKHTRAFFNSADIQRLHDKGIELSLENYQRNYFSSSADIRLSIRPFSGQPTWYSTTLHARIHHAPLVNSGINLFSATLTNSATDGSLAAYIPDNHLHIKASPRRSRPAAPDHPDTEKRNPQPQQRRHQSQLAQPHSPPQSRQRRMAAR